MAQGLAPSQEIEDAEEEKFGSETAEVEKFGSERAEVSSSICNETAEASSL